MKKRIARCLSLATLWAGAAAMASAQTPGSPATTKAPKTPATAVTVPAVLTVPSVPATRAEIDKPVGDFVLMNVAGDKPVPFRLSDYKGKKNVVLVWMSYNCSVTRAYEERLGKLLTQYSTPDSDNIFVAVHANAPETNERIKRYAETANFTGAVLDDKQKAPGLTEYFGARATPTVVIIDKDGVFRFRGRIDNNPGDLRGEDPERKEFVVSALSAIKNNKEIAVKTSPTPG